MDALKIYVASSWRNERQPGVVAALRGNGYEVYDFKNPPKRSGFAWSQIEPEWKTWTTEEYIAHLDHPDAEAGFAEDIKHLLRAHVTVLVMPCGRSAHLELGWAAGMEQFTAILLEEKSEPELMYKMVDLITPQLSEVINWLQELEQDLEL